MDQETLDWLLRSMSIDQLEAFAKVLGIECEPSHWAKHQWMKNMLEVETAIIDKMESLWEQENNG